MFLAEPVLKTVLPITVWAAHAWIFQGVDECFAGDMVALVRIVDIGFLGRSAVLVGVGVGVSAPSPFACVGAFVCCFGAVVQAECASAGFAAEGEEV